MIAKKATVLIIAFVAIVFSAGAQGDDITIRIVKKRHPWLDLLHVDIAKDQAPWLNWGGAYKVMLRDADPRWIRSATSTQGYLSQQDTLLTLRLPDARSISTDSVTIAVTFTRAAPVDTVVVYRRLYIRPNVTTPVNNGFTIYWREGPKWNMQVRTQKRLGSASFYVNMADLATAAAEDIYYQDADSSSLPARKFDSLSVNIRTHKGPLAYHLTGARLPDEAINIIRTLRSKDRIYVRLFYKGNDGKMQSYTLDFTVRRREPLLQIRTIHSKAR